MSWKQTNIYTNHKNNPENMLNEKLQFNSNELYNLIKQHSRPIGVVGNGN